MARNRNRKRSNMAGPVFPVPLAIVLLLAGALALSYIWLTGRCDELGLRIKDLEKERDQLQRKVVTEEYRWSNMTSPQNMQKLIEAHGLSMSWPTEKNIIRIPRVAAPQTAILAHNDQYAARPARIVHD